MKRLNHKKLEALLKLLEESITPEVFCLRCNKAWNSFEHNRCKCPDNLLLFEYDYDSTDIDGAIKVLQFILGKEQKESK